MPGSHFQNKTGMHVERASRTDWLEEAVNEVARNLPVVQPLSHYEHDHPLRPWMHLDFADALRYVEQAYGVESLLSPTEYAEHCFSGRIDTSQLSQYVAQSLTTVAGDALLDADPLTALQLGTRHSLRMAALVVPEIACDYDVEAWIENSIDETQTACRENPKAMSQDFRSWLTGNLSNQMKCDDELVQYLERDTIGRRMSKWNQSKWGIAREYAMWWYCRRGTKGWRASFESGGRVRQLISQHMPSIDEELRQLVVPFLSAYRDPGVAAWRLPQRDPSILNAFAAWFAQSPRSAFGSHLHHQQLTVLLNSHATMDPLASVELSLRALQVRALDAPVYLHDVTSVLRGWAGLLNTLRVSEYPCQPALRNFSIAEFIAILLLIDRTAIATKVGGNIERVPVAEFSRSLQRQAYTQHQRQLIATRQTWLFRLARYLNWSPSQLHGLRAVDWSTIHHELNSFPKFERQWIAHCAFEQSYRQSVCAALVHAQSTRPTTNNVRKPAFLLFTCAEPCEESFRRHLESVCHAVETVGVPGFFNLDIKFKDCQSSHYVPHAPTNVRKRHLVCEVKMEPPFRERTLEIEQPLGTAADLSTQIGFTIGEMAAITSQLLVDTGVASRLPAVVVVMGHESSSVNNLYETADNCTFCSKQNVQVNTRAFVKMANDPRVRETMRLDGVTIPDETLFVAAVHHTCSDAISYLDTDTIPLGHSHELASIMAIMDQAAKRNALERMQRLTTRLRLNAEQALSLADDHQESGAHARPEYSLMGNALCIIGRRQLTRGVKLDRRAFLFSYDPSQDDQDLTCLARLLVVNLPVLANICFDYWFSRATPDRFGSGRKAELKLIAHMGVCDTEHGDLRVGLPYEMVDQHEPMRLQVIVDAQPELVERMLAANPLANRFFARGTMLLSAMHAGQCTAIGQSNDSATS